MIVRDFNEEKLTARRVQTTSWERAGAPQERWDGAYH